ncbi:S41 family peptidase [Sphingomonas mucosissima]|nr:S41 family peptidase [Sphingomonas mucosissima]
MSLLAGCGGDGGGSGNPIASGPSPAPSPAPTTSTCSLQSRQTWAAAELREWYLFPDTLPPSLDGSRYASVDAYVDALTATARAQNKDRYFTYITSIAEENAYYASGSSAGYGFRLGIDAGAARMFVIEAFEGAPALEAGIDRGTEILAIGRPGTAPRTVSALFASGGAQAVSDALGGEQAGDARLLRVRAPNGVEREVTLSPRDFELNPVSPRYGVTVIEDEGRRVGYINLRTFISTADQPLRDGFARMRAAGITDFIIDFRYNGGGLVSTANLIGDLLGANRQRSEVFNYTTYRREKSSENRVDYFTPQPQSVAPTRIAFIGTGGTASASELVINGMIPYLRANVALIGTNTYGKPVGQIARDRAACDDRLRVVAFAGQNADRQGDYYNGLAPVMPATCRADDDLSYPLGDPREASVRQALAFIAGRSCTPIGGASATASAARTRDVAVPRDLLAPARPSTFQRETPGAF